MSGSEPRPARRSRYSRSLVRTILWLQRWLSKLGLADVVYVLAAFVPYLVYRFWILGRNHIEVRGRERLPPRGTGFFLLSNHVSMAEAPGIATLLFPRPFWFPAKVEFYKNWLIGLCWFSITAMHTFPVRRGERDTAAIGLMEQFLKDGDSVLLFPEGTRSPDGELLPGKKGVGMIIHNAQPLVVPVYVRGFERIWPPEARFPTGRGQRAVVVFGEPLDLSHRWEQSFDKAVAQGIVDEVMEAIAGLKRDLEEQEAREGQAGTPAEAPVQEQPTA